MKANGGTGITKLIGAFSSLAKAPKDTAKAVYCPRYYCGKLLLFRSAQIHSSNPGGIANGYSALVTFDPWHPTKSTGLYRFEKHLTCLAYFHECHRKWNPFYLLI
jgi:hypothetical protein